jgi:hypothetical protein
MVVIIRNVLIITFPIKLSERYLRSRTELSKMGGEGGPSVV